MRLGNLEKRCFTLVDQRTVKSPWRVLLWTSYEVSWQSLIQLFLEKTEFCGNKTVWQLQTEKWFLMKCYKNMVPRLRKVSSYKILNWMKINFMIAADDQNHDMGCHMHPCFFLTWHLLILDSSYPKICFSFD